ncbi:MAG: transglutaminase domain-containing protein [Akkermansiaceae bacterium]|jgi:transglutaminase-like putative cysteine protease
MRSILLIIAIALSYALLRGWPDNWHPILRVCLAVSALVVAFGIWGRTDKSSAPEARPARSPRWLDYLTVGIAVLLVESFFLIFLSTAPSVGENLADSFDEALHPESYTAAVEAPENQPTGGPGKGDDLTTGGNWLFPGLGNRPLNKSANLRPSNRPEVYLFPKTKKDARQLLASQRFLRMFTLATYENGEWAPDSIIPVTRRAQGDSIIFLAPPPSPVTYEVSHQASISGQTLAVTLPDIASIRVPALRETAPDTFRLPPISEGQTTYRYQVTSVLRTLDEIPAPASPGASPSPDYLALPDDPLLRAKIETLADSFGPPTLTALINLRKTLNATCQYSLKVDMPDEADPLDSFLFETNIGYCTHFASATVMLARALGYPARMAYGWSGGRYFAGPNLFVFRAREAHAWAEIYLRNYGWVIFETTPVDRTEGTATIADADEPPPLPNYSDNDEEDSATPLTPLLKTATWIAAGSLLALILALLIRRPADAPGDHSPATSILPDPPNYLAAFRRACKAHGLPMPPGRTLRAHLEGISDPSFTGDLLAYHYSVQYGNSPREKSREKRLLSQIRHWEKQAPPPV